MELLASADQQNLMKMQTTESSRTLQPTALLKMLKDWTVLVEQILTSLAMIQYLDSIVVLILAYLQNPKFKFLLLQSVK